MSKTIDRDPMRSAEITIRVEPHLVEDYQAASPERRGKLQNLFMAMIGGGDGDYFPDWALEEINDKAREGTLTASTLQTILEEAYEDVIDLRALAAEQEDKESLSLDEVKAELGLE